MTRGPVRAGELLEARRALIAADPVLERLDPETPKLKWPVKQAGFSGLARLIVEQQLSAAASHTIWRGLAPTGRLTPTIVASLGEDGLHDHGLARPKARSLLRLATLFASGDPLASLAMQDDASAEGMLVRLPGLGPWSAASYLLWTLGRPDVFPAGDAALGRAISAAYQRPADDQPAIVERWRPYRGVGALFIATWFRGRQSTSPTPKPLAQKETAHV